MRNIGDSIDTYRIVWQQTSSALAENYIVERASNPGSVYLLQLWIGAHFTSRQDYIDFLSQMQALKTLESPYILSPEDFGTDVDDCPYIVLPHAATTLESLDKRLQRDPLTEDETRNVLTNVGLALVLAHQHGCVHGLLSPENILLTAAGSVLVSAFRSSALDTSSIRASLPVAYRFPEQQASRLSDQYALAGLVQTLQPDQTAETSEQQATARAQSPDPTQRFPSIRAFLSQVDIPLNLPESVQELEQLPESVKNQASAASQDTAIPTQPICPEARTGTGQPRASRTRTRSRQNLARVALCLLVIIGLIALHILLPASAATVTILPKTQTLNQTYNLTVGTQTNLSAGQLGGQLLNYKTPTIKKTSKVENIEDIDAMAAQGNVVISQITSSIDLNLYDLDIDLDNGLELRVTDQSTDMEPGQTYTEPVTVNETGSQSNLPAHAVDGTYSFSIFLVSSDNTTAFVSNPDPITGGEDAYNGPVVSQLDIDTATSAALSEEHANALQHFQSELKRGETLFNSITCTQTSHAEPGIGARVPKITVSSTATCQGEVYDQQGSTAAFISAAQQLAAHSFDSHFALIHPVTITLTSSGAPVANSQVSFNVQSSWRLLLDKRGQQAVQQALTGLSQDDAKTLLLKRYAALTTNLSLNWWWGGHMPTDPNAIQLVAHYPATSP